MGSRADNVSKNEERSTSEGDISASEKIGKGTDKGADGSQGEQIGQDEPDPSVGAANVSVDIWRNTTCSIETPWLAFMFPCVSIGLHLLTKQSSFYNNSMSSMRKKKRLLPKRYSGIWDPVQRKAMATRDMIRRVVIYKAERKVSTLKEIPHRKCTLIIQGVGNKQ